MNAIARLNIRTKKGARPAARRARARSRPHDRRRRRRCYPLYLSGPEATAITAIVDLAKRRRVA